MIKRFYYWAPQWRDKPSTHEVIVEIERSPNNLECTSIATCPNEGWAKKVEQAMNELLKAEVKP